MNMTTDEKESRIEARLNAVEAPAEAAAEAATETPETASSPKPSAPPPAARKIKVKGDDDADLMLDLDNPKDVERLTREYGSGRKVRQVMKEAAAIKAE